MRVCVRVCVRVCMRLCESVRACMCFNFFIIYKYKYITRNIKYDKYNKIQYNTI